MAHQSKKLTEFLYHIPPYTLTAIVAISFVLDLSCDKEKNIPMEIEKACAILSIL